MFLPICPRLCLVSVLFLPVLAGDPTEAGSSQFALWVSFFEIYNECVYDLLQPSLCSKSKKRSGLRVCDDGAGNAYVKGVRMMCVLRLKHISYMLLNA